MDLESRCIVLFDPCSENIGADQLCKYCAFVFAYADCWFSHAAAHMSMFPHPLPFFTAFKFDNSFDKLETSDI